MIEFSHEYPGDGHGREFGLESDTNRFEDKPILSKLLTKDEEVELAKLILPRTLYRNNQERELKNRLGRPLTYHDLYPIFQTSNRLFPESYWAANKLVEANLGIAYKIARNYQDRGIEFYELKQEGVLGLIHATHKFDYKKGNRFATYSGWWVRAFIEKSIAKSANTIRLPNDVQLFVNRMNRNQDELIQEKAKVPTPKELAKHFGIPHEYMMSVLRALNDPKSIYHEDGNHLPIYQTLKDTSNAFEAPEEEAVRVENRQHLLNFLKEKLTQDEFCVMLLTYGFTSENQAKTIKEISQECKMYKTRIKKLIDSALEKLKTPDSKEKLACFLANL